MQENICTKIGYPDTNNNQEYTLMNKRFFINLVVGLSTMLSLTSCPSDEKGDITGDVELQASPTTVVLSEQNTGTVTVTSNASWAVFSSASWLTVSPAEGTNSGMFTITATSSNTGQTARTATLTISDKAGRKTVMVTVTQNPATTPSREYFLTIDKTEMSFEAGGGESQFSIFTDDEWTITSSAAWCKVMPDRGIERSAVIKVAVDANESTEQRTASVIVKGVRGASPQTITVSQNGADPTSVDVSITDYGSDENLNNK